MVTMVHKRNCLFISPPRAPGRRHAAGGRIMFCRRFSFFIKCRPSHSTTGGRIATRIVALTPSVKKFLRLKCGELRSRDVAIATNFVAVDKLAYSPLLFVLAFENGWKDRKTSTREKTPDEHSISCKHFLNFGSVRPTPEILWWVCRKWMDTHMQKYSRLRCFHQSTKIALRRTFHKYKGGKLAL